MKQPYGHGVPAVVCVQKFASKKAGASPSKEQLGFLQMSQANNRRNTNDRWEESNLFVRAQVDEVWSCPVSGANPQCDGQHVGNVTVSCKGNLLNKPQITIHLSLVMSRQHRDHRIQISFPKLASTLHRSAAYPWQPLR